ncbi:uncharacterized protein LOC134237160 [Saccostrea cucullata]|uniref:uncharacterized protein LOC134237160 n=1 Tax=Saccostrea cuccullata TaxID=36930 RepID=UPI002ED4307D
MDGDEEFENATVPNDSERRKSPEDRGKNLNTEKCEKEQGDRNFQNKSDECQQDPQEFKTESESLRKMKEEMEKMRLEDHRKEEIAAAIYKRDFKRERAKIEEETIARGYMFNPDIRDIKGAIAEIMNEERTFMLQRQIDALDKEEKQMQAEIDKKYGLLFSKEGRQNLTDLADKFFSLPGNAGLPEHITRSLTSEEIADLKVVFDMFDVKGKGYINATDLKKALAMLGFRASKAVLGNMISEVAGENKVRVTFTNFLDFVVKSQGDGPDPYGEIKQAFELLDTKGTGFLTLEDLREASSECSLNFSNTALREMIQEADKHGEGKISLQDFTDIMLQTSRFKFAA